MIRLFCGRIALTDRARRQRNLYRSDRHGFNLPGHEEKAALVPRDDFGRGRRRANVFGLDGVSLKTKEAKELNPPPRQQ